MSQTRRCPQCSAELPSDAPPGVCPKCLLNLGLQGESAASGDPGPTATSGQAPRFTPPTVGELAPSFPQLEIERLIGQGGMGAVYKARQMSLDRPVALKILPSGAGRDPAFTDRFKREAKSLARLSHPNIVNVFDFGEADGLFFFIMEYVDGLNLRQTIRAGKLASHEALAIVPQICEALQFAHDEGVVHRDIKPENILLDKKGRVKIADFGLAKLLGKAPTELTLTGTHQVMGTLHYMAPEQIEQPAAVDHRADIYSLGVVFYELLTGELPLGRFALPSEKSDVAADLDNVVLRALERDPARRYQRASEVKTDVESASAHETPQPGAPPRAWTQSVPFFISDLYAGTAKAVGLLRFDGARLSLEAEIRDEIFGTIKSKPKSAIIELRELVSIEYQSGMMRSSIRIQCDSLMPIAGLPNKHPGQLVVYVTKPDRDAAEKLVEAVQKKIGRPSPPQPAAAPPTPAQPVDAAAIPARSAALRQVRGPAAGLFVVALLNFGILALLLLTALVVMPSVRVQRQMGRSASPIVVDRNAAIASAGGGMGLHCVWTSAAVVGQEGPAIQLPHTRNDFVIMTAALPVVMVCVFLPMSGVIFLGALKMRHLESYGLAVGASVLAMLPCHPAFIVGLPIGIWSLAVLLKPEVRRAFGASASGASAPPAQAPAQPAAPPAKPGPTEELSPGQHDAAHRKLRIPAIGLLVAGVLNCLSLLLLVIPLAIFLVGGRDTGIGAPGLMELSVLAVACALGVLLIAGGARMLACRAYNLAVLTCILGLVPCTPAWLISLPFSIWALLVLNNSDVQAAFKEKERSLDDFTDSSLDFDSTVSGGSHSRSNRRGCLLLALIGLVCLAPIAAIMTPFVSYTFSRSAPARTGATLVFRPEATPEQLRNEAFMNELLIAVRRRLDAKANVATFAKVTSDRRSSERRIEVDVHDFKVQSADRVEQLLSWQGVVEWRVLAHAMLDERYAIPAQQTIAPALKDGGRDVAKWVTVDDRARGYLEGDETIVTRTIDGRIEALVLIDTFDISASHIQLASAIHESRGSSIYITFTAPGGRRMRDLTGQFVPDSDEAPLRRIGVIVDGALYAAPTVRAAIEQRAEVAFGAEFAADEVEELAEVLTLAPLPAALRLERRSDLLND